MRQLFKNWILTAATAAAFSLPFASGAFADTTSQPVQEASETMEKAGEVVSDTWITSKVKSTFLADKNLSALDIKVETNQGVVALSGTVKSEAERDLAITKAEGIKGVTAVSADGLKTSE